MSKYTEHPGSPAHMGTLRSATATDAVCRQSSRGAVSPPQAFVGISKEFLGLGARGS